MLNLGFLNFYMSALRNMFLTSSIAIAIAGYSDRLKNLFNKRIIKSIAFLILIISASIGLKSTYEYKKMVSHLSTQDNLSDDEKAVLQSSETWPIVAYFYVAFLMTLFFVMFYRNRALYFF